MLTVSGGDALTPETVELDTMDTMEATEAAGETEALETMETMEALETMETMEEISNEENIRLLTDIESSLSETIATLLEENNELLTKLNEYEEVRQTAEAYTIWDKPLEEYTVSEGLSLIDTFILLGIIVFSIIGGIITCNL